MAAVPSKESRRGLFFPNLPVTLKSDSTTQTVKVEQFLPSHAASHSPRSLSEVYQITIGEMSCVAKLFCPGKRHGNRTYADEKRLLTQLKEVACLIPTLGEWIVKEEIHSLLYLKKGVSLRVSTDELAHTFTLEDIQNIGLQLISGLGKLQKEGYFHRNLTLDHILLDEGRIYITSSRHISPLPYFVVDNPLDFPDLNYSAPEVYLHKELHEKSSLFAVASAIYYLYTKSFPFPIAKTPYPEELPKEEHWVWDRAAELLAQVNALGPFRTYRIDEIPLNKKLESHQYPTICFPKKADLGWSKVPMPASLRLFFAELFLYLPERCNLKTAYSNLSRLNSAEEPSIPIALERAIPEKEMAQQIGKGSFGRIYLLPNNVGDKPHVIKTVSTENLSSYYEVTNEIQIHSHMSFHSPSNRICRLLAYEFEKTKVHLLFEKQEETLYALTRRTVLLPLQIKQLFSQISEAVLFLAQKGLSHNDLSATNVMVTAGEASLIDFGKAKIRTGEKTAKGDHFSTITIRTPEEYFINEWLTGKRDIWALGILLFEMIVPGQHPLFTSQQNINKVPDHLLIDYIIQQLGPLPAGKGLFEYIKTAIQEVPPWRERLFQIISKRENLGLSIPGEFDKALEILNGALQYAEARATAVQIHALAMEFLGGVGPTVGVAGEESGAAAGGLP